MAQDEALAMYAGPNNITALGAHFAPIFVGVVKIVGDVISSSHGIGHGLAVLIHTEQPAGSVSINSLADVRRLCDAAGKNGTTFCNEGAMHGFVQSVTVVPVFM